jgi:hypothetical protein
MYYRLNLVRILNFLLFLVIVFSPFQNTLLRESNLRYLGASPSFLFVITIILLYIFKKIYQWTNFDFRVNVSSLITGVYLIIAFLLGFTVYFGEVSYERDLIGKGFSLIILNFLLLFPFYVSFNLNEKYCLIGIKLALGVMIIALITFDYLSPTYLDNSFFQSNVRPSFRPRGFSPEPSYFAVSFFCLLIGGFVLQRKKNFILFYYLKVLFLACYYH